MKLNRRRLFSLAAETTLFGTVVSLIPGCSKEKKKKPETPMMPKGVKVDLGNKHTPRCLLVDDGDHWILKVVVKHVVNKGHHIRGVKIAGPGPDFRMVDAHDYTDAYIAKAEDQEWKHDFRFPKFKVPIGAKHLVVWSHCNKHGDHGMTQGV